jgi:hypothetical protein
LFAIIAGSIVAVLVSLAIVIYRLFAEILGVERSDALLEGLGDPLSVLLVAAGLLAYHAMLLRADLAESARTTDGQGVTLRFVVTGPSGSDTETIAATLQANLPAGYVVRSVSRSD